MRKEIKTKILVVKMDKERIGLFNSLVDGAGRLGICRTRSNREGIVDIISSPDTFEELKSVVRRISAFLGGIEIIDELDWENNEDMWR